MPAGLAAPQPVDAVGVPLPATFAVPRTLLELEDARIDYGSIDASPADLARLVLVRFATVFSDDWLVQPVRVPIGGASANRVVLRHRLVWRRAQLHRST